MAGQKIRIRLKSYDHEVIDSSSVLVVRPVTDGPEGSTLSLEVSSGNTPFFGRHACRVLEAFVRDARAHGVTVTVEPWRNRLRDPRD